MYIWYIVDFDKSAKIIKISRKVDKPNTCNVFNGNILFLRILKTFFLE